MVSLWYLYGIFMVKHFTNVLLSNRSRKGSLGLSGIFMVSLWYLYGGLLKPSILRSLVSLWYLYGIFMVSLWYPSLLTIL